MRWGEHCYKLYRQVDVIGRKDIYEYTKSPKPKSPTQIEQLNTIILFGDDESNGSVLSQMCMFEFDGFVTVDSYL